MPTVPVTDEGSLMSNPARQPYLTESVHYMARGSADGEYPPVCRAAMITEVHPVGATAAVVVFNPTGIFLHQSLAHDEKRAPGSWHFAHA